MKSLKPALVAAVLLFTALCVGTPAMADFKAGLAAFKKGDFAAALKVWKPLAEKGDPRAQFALGTMYDKGKGVTKDPKKSAYWYRLSAEQCDSRAQAILGLKYFLGSGVPKDPAESYKWLNLAYFFGMKKIKPQMLDLEKTQPPAVIEKGRAEGAALVRKRAEAGDYMAEAVMGTMYALGRGVPKDLVQAYMWLHLAYINGFKEGDALRDAVGSKMKKADVARAKKMAESHKAFKKGKR